MKRIAILALVIGLASPIFAERPNLKDRADGWLQEENSGGLRGTAPGIGGEDPGPDPNLPGSIGGGLAVLFAMGGAYVLRKK